MTKHTILFLAANPIETDRLELDRQVHEIQVELERSRWRDHFELVTRWAAEPIDLLRELRRLAPTVIQFSGHGGRAPDARQAATQAEPGATRDVVGADAGVDATSCHGLFFQGSDGRPRIVTAVALGEAFGAAGASVRLVVLNACYSEPAAGALLEHVECVVGMAGSIGDGAARSFAIGFYGGLGDRESVAAAFRQGCAAISLEGLREADRPRLRVREGVDAERLVLAAEDSPRGASALDAAHAGPLPDIGAPAPLSLVLERVLAGEASEPDAALLRDAVLRGALAVAPGGLVVAPVPGPPSSASLLVSGARTFPAKITERQFIDSLLPPPPGIAPPFPQLLFIGRDRAIRDLQTRLGERIDDVAPQVIIRGFPGVGKTTLSGFLARDPQLRRCYPDGVLWASVGEQPQIMQQLAAWARALGRHDLLRVASPLEAADEMRALLGGKRMLLLVDDVWTPEDAVPFQRARPPGCALVVTTRITETAEALSGADDVYYLPVLEERDALELVRVLAPSVVEQHPDGCAELVRDLGCLPLALVVAGKLLRAEAKHGWGVDSLLREIRDGARILEADAPSDRSEAGHIPKVQALLSRSTDRLSQSARECFACLGVFAPKPATFDLEAMAAVWELDDARPIVRELVGYGLLEPSGAARFQMHALLVAHAKSLLGAS